MAMRLLRAYLGSTWIPAVTMVIVSVVSVLVFRPKAAYAVHLFFGLVAVGAITLCTAVYQTSKRAPFASLLTAGSAVVFGGGGTFVLFSMVVLSDLFDDDPDPFGRDIEIPPDLVLKEPLTSGSPPSATMASSDLEGQTLQDSCGATPSPNPSATIDVGLSALARFRGSARERLLLHLSQSPVWQVGIERDRRYAYRTFHDDPLQSSLHGYYGGTRCGYRIVIGIDGPAMAKPWSDLATYGKLGESLNLRERRQDGSVGYQSYLVVVSDGPSVEIFEDSVTSDRALTRAALALVERELARAAAPASESAPQASATAPQASATAPQGSGEKPSIQLVSGLQGGIYRVYARVNPGGPGRVYLKVFEHTHNTRLSEERLTKASTRIVGWSKDPSELFLYNTEVTVYEGDWGVYYPARFELWFVPGSGAEERKLIEDVFKIEGWMR